MANRKARLIIKNNSVPNAPFTGATLFQGEAIVNTADGIMMFSGVTQSTSNWTPAGTGAAANFFEVGSNLYDLDLRHRIMKYENISGAGLVNKFLSGTTNGFVLADISTIVGVDTYVTAFTYNNNVFTIKQNVGQPDLSVIVNTMTGLTINGNLTVTGNSIFNNVTITGTGLYNNIATGASGSEIVNYSTLTSYTQSKDVYVTGNTYTPATNNSNANLFNLLYHGVPIAGPYTLNGKDTFTTGGTYNSGTTALDFKRNDGLTYSVDISAIDINDTYVTAFTYNNNTFSIAQSPGGPNLSATINSVTGLTVNGNLTVTGNTNLSGTSNYSQTATGASATEIVNYNTLTAYTKNTDVYVTGNTYTPATNNTNATTTGLLYHGTPLNGPYTLSAKDTFITGTTWSSINDVLTSRRNDGTVINTTIDTFSGITTGDLTVNNDVIVKGSLTVLGASVSAFTSQLYVEDNNISLNYNPTGSTVATSICAGWTIQDGNGIAGGDVYFDIEPMNAFTGITAANVPSIVEYTSSTGYANRAWVTQLNDIVIRSNKAACDGIPNGVRVLAEFDTLDGGSY